MESIVNDVTSIRKPEVRIIKNGYLKASDIIKINIVYNTKLPIQNIKHFLLLQIYTLRFFIIILMSNSIKNKISEKCLFILGTLKLKVR
jgi:hypothetical protein